MPSNRCQFTKLDNERCKRSVALGKRFCWQHAHGLRAKWQSLTRNQTILFLVGVAGLAATLWFGFHGVPSTTVTNKTIHVQSSGDQSPNIVDNQGKVDIHNQKPDAQKRKPGSQADGLKQ
jgi:hypothetical protein